MRQAISDEHGKIQKALWVTESFPEEVEADLQRYYGVALSSLGRDLSWRRLLVLVDHLPAEGALNTAIRNATPADMLAVSAGDSAQAPWSALEMLTAALVDELRQLNWMFASVNSGGQNIKRPELVRRPGTETQRGKLMSIESARMLDPRLRGLDDDEVRERMAGRAS